MDKPHDITLFARTNFRNKEVPFGIKTDDRRRHMYLIGKTGMGKTTMMENMVIQDIRNGHGVAFLDPHGDSIQRILNCVPSSRVNDVVYFNPADLEHPVAFNILEAVDTKYKHLVASGLMGVFTKIWANLWSARMEYILNNTILALLDSPGNTLLGITRMYVDKKYRKRIVDNIKDPMVKAFWVDEFANYNEKYRTEAIAPIQNKVGQFLSSGIIRNIVGQPKSTIDLREIMDQRKILIMDLSKGRVGEDNSALLGAMIVTKLQLAAMSRTDIPETERKDFYLYVDEFQNFATDSFATILSEARKYRLNLIVGHQYIAQLEQDKNTKVRDAIFGNVGTIVVFRIGAADAEFLETEFEPIFTPTDLVNLPKYSIILKLMINGVASEPFSAITMAPNPDYITDNGEKVIKVSRERYSNSVEEVEDKISRWMGVEFHQDSATLIGEGETENNPSIDAENKNTEVTKADAQMPLEVKFEPLKIPEEALPTPPKPEMSQISEDLEFSEVQEEPIKKVLEIPSKPKSQEQTHRPKLQRSENAFRDHRQHKNQPSGDRKNYTGIDRRIKQKQPQKKENPIWNTVAEIHEDKKKSASHKINETVQTLLTERNDIDESFSAINPSPSTLTPNASQTVLKPGESHKF